MTGGFLFFTHLPQPDHFALLLRLCLSGKNKSVQFRKASVSKVVSCKVHTLHPEPNTLLSYVHRASLFLTSSSLGRQVLYKHYLATVLPVTTGKASGSKFPFFFFFFLSLLLLMSLWALQGGHSHTVLVCKVTKTQSQLHLGWVS